MHKIGKGFSALTSAASSRLVAGALTIPFLCALPSYVDSDTPWRNLGLGAGIAALFLAAEFVVRRMLRPAEAGRMAAAFAFVFLSLGLLGAAGAEHYRFEEALTDLGLLYLAFFCAVALGWVARPLGRALLDAERLRGYSAMTAVLLPFRSAFDD